MNRKLKHKTSKAAISPVFASNSSALDFASKGVHFDLKNDLISSYNTRSFQTETRLGKHSVKNVPGSRASKSSMKFYLNPHQTDYKEFVNLLLNTKQTANEPTGSSLPRRNVQTKINYENTSLINSSQNAIKFKSMSSNNFDYLLSNGSTDTELASAPNSMALINEFKYLSNQEKFLDTSNITYRLDNFFKRSKMAVSFFLNVNLI